MNSFEYVQKQQYERNLDNVVRDLEQLLKYQEMNYEPYNERQTKIAIRALLNIRGFKNLKSFHYGDNEKWQSSQ